MAHARARPPHEARQFLKRSLPCTTNSYYGDLGTEQPHCFRFNTLRRCREEWTSRYGKQNTEGWGGDTTGITLMNGCPEWVPKA